jgi:predicted RNA-binding Zn-ribbon protein involved in translation (DUF1610 family)
MTDSDRRPGDEPQVDSPKCPSCGEQLDGAALTDLECPACGEGLPPRLGI